MKRMEMESQSGYVEGYANKKMRASPTNNNNNLRDNEEAGGIPVSVLLTGAAAAAGGETTSPDKAMKVGSHGFLSIIGRRRVMEDAVTVALGEIDAYDFFAVYDGHGGAQVANACGDRLHLIVAEELEERLTRGGGGDGDRHGLEFWENVMSACFLKMDQQVCLVRSGSGSDAEDDGVMTVGSTALVVMVGEEELVVANCGDSRAVLCRGGVAVPLSCDHKPNRPDEKERVEAAGGRIINWNGCRVLGVLATSRSIGDEHLKPYVICEPEVTVNARAELDDFLVLGSDGLWDVVSNEFACEVVRKCLSGELRMRFPGECTGSCAAEAATILTELAVARGSKHNISVIVVELKKSTTVS